MKWSEVVFLLGLAALMVFSRLIDCHAADGPWYVQFLAHGVVVRHGLPLPDRETCERVRAYIEAARKREHLDGEYRCGLKAKEIGA